MPLYDVECEDCGAEDTVLHSFKEAHPPCEQCGGTRKTVFKKAPPVHFKGIGWSGDNYASTEMGDRAKSDAADRKAAKDPNGRGRGFSKGQQ